MWAVVGKEICEICQNWQGTVGVERSVREREVEREKNTGGSERKIREEREFKEASV